MSRTLAIWLRWVGIEPTYSAYETVLEPPPVYPAKLCFHMHIEESNLIQAFAAYSTQRRLGLLDATITLDVHVKTEIISFCF